MNRLAKLIATVCGVGLSPVAPGTIGSLAALPMAWGLHWLGGFPLLALATLGAFFKGWWATIVYTAQPEVSEDPSEVVIDEVAGMWIALLPFSYVVWQAGTVNIANSWPVWGAAFLFFRVFDIFKPGPVGWADRRGDPLGVMLDDVIAGVFAAIAVTVFKLGRIGRIGIMTITKNHLALAAEILELARKRDVKITAAESCTGGLLTSTLTEIPGSSYVVERSFITYSNEAKIEMLGVAKRLIEDHGAVSERVARAMAEGALRESRADLAISITGVAGPGATGVKPEGRVCFGLAPDGEETRTVTVEFGALGRAAVRAASVHYALTMMREVLA